MDWSTHQKHFREHWTLFYPVPVKTPCSLDFNDASVFCSFAGEHLQLTAEMICVLASTNMSQKILHGECFRTAIAYLGHVVKPNRLIVPRSGDVS